MQIIKTAKHEEILVDDEDYDVLSLNCWYVNNQGYAVRSAEASVGQDTQVMHRLILKAPKGKKVDHANHNKLDNRKVNLRICTHAENMRNRKPVKPTSSKFKGVHWLKDRNKWRAKLRLNGKNISLGNFTSEVAAAQAYDLKAQEVHGEFALTNKQLGLL